MSTFDYLVDIALVLVIFWQARPRELTARSAALPLVVLALACQHYLRGFAVADNDVLLIILLTTTGLALGTWSGCATRVWHTGSEVLAQVGITAAATWVAGMGARFAFAVWASSTGGAAALGRISAAHGISSGQAWTTALVAMALAEVLARVGIMQWRRTQVRPVGGLQVRGERRAHEEVASARTSGL